MTAALTEDVPRSMPRAPLLQPLAQRWGSGASPDQGHGGISPEPLVMSRVGSTS